MCLYSIDKQNDFNKKSCKISITKLMYTNAIYILTNKIEILYTPYLGKSDGITGMIYFFVFDDRNMWHQHFLNTYVHFGFT